MKSFQSTAMARLFVVCLLASFLVAFTVFEVNAEMSANEIYKIRKKSENGDAHAQKLLGDLFFRKKDMEQFIYWYTKAAEQGDAEAQDLLGVHYYQNGEYVWQDNRKAFYWHSKAAEQGYASSYFYLGYFYGDGIGVPQNYIYSYAWYSLSVSNSSTEFDLNNYSRYRDEIAKKIVPSTNSSSPGACRRASTKNRQSKEFNKPASNTIYNSRE